MSSDSPCFEMPLAAGRRCLVEVAVPAGRAPREGWPVAYLLDIAQHRAVRAQAVPLPGVLVGLGPVVPQDRRWDYVPARWAGPQGVPEAPAGAGAAGWLRMLGPLRARMAARYPLDARRQVLCGHSLGGLFALYAMLHQPRAFDGYVISSPSVWWGDRYAERLLRRRRAWLCRAGLPALGVALTVGECEQGLGPGDEAASPEEQARRLAMRRARRMVDGMWDLGRMLARCEGLRIRHQVLPGYNHHTASQAALLAGWQWLLGA